MNTSRRIITVEVTTQLRIAPDEEKARFAKFLKGASLERLVAMVEHIEAGRFYDGAKMYYKECTQAEREACGLSMAAIFEGVGSRELNKKLWQERDPGATWVVNEEGDWVSQATLGYPKYSLGTTKTEPCPAL